MTQPSKPAALLGSLALAFVLVAGSLVSLDAVIADSTPYEEQVHEALDAFGEPRPDTLRVVIIGDSLSRNAFGDGSEVEAALARQGIAAQVANLGGGGVELATAEPAFDAILAAEPDVVVLQPEALLFWEEHPGPPDLRLRLRWLFTDQYWPKYFDLYCPDNAQTPAVLQGSVLGTRERLPDSVLLVNDADELIAAAADRGIEVLVASLPRSAPLDEAVGELTDEFRRRVVDHVAAYPNVAVAPDVELPGPDNYCDFSHMNPSGRAAFLDMWASGFADFVAGSD